MTKTDQMSNSNTPAPIRMLTLIVSILVAISALPWLWMSMTQFRAFAWGVFGFEFCVILGAVMTMLVALKKLRVGNAFSLALACLAGTILVSMVFGTHVEARTLIGDDPKLQPWVNRTLLFRVAAVGLLSLIATLDVYRRSSKSWGLILRSIFFLAPVLVALGWIMKMGMPTINDSSGELSPTRMIIALLSGLLIGIFFSIGGHYLIRSFEVSFPEPGLASEPEKSKD